MNCPHCDREMEEGFFESDCIFWSKQVRRLFLFPEEKGEFFIRGSLKTGCTFKAYLCKRCNHILFDYEDGRIFDANEGLADT